MKPLIALATGILLLIGNYSFASNFTSFDTPLFTFPALLLIGMLASILIVLLIAKPASKNRSSLLKAFGNLLILYTLITAYAIHSLNQNYMQRMMFYNHFRLL